MKITTNFDIGKYRQILDTLPSREKVCGFVSRKAEIEAWEKSDLFQFCHDTTAIFGSLDELADRQCRGAVYA